MNNPHLTSAWKTALGSLLWINNQEILKQQKVDTEKSILQKQFFQCGSWVRILHFFKLWPMQDRSALSASTIRKLFEFQIQREQWAFQKLKSAIYVLNPKKGVSCITVKCPTYCSLDVLFWKCQLSSIVHMVQTQVQSQNHKNYFRFSFVYLARLPSFVYLQYIFKA